MRAVHTRYVEVNRARAKPFMSLVCHRWNPVWKRLLTLWSRKMEMPHNTDTHNRRNYVTETDHWISIKKDNSLGPWATALMNNAFEKRKNCKSFRFIFVQEFYSNPFVSCELFLLLHSLSLVISEVVSWKMSFVRALLQMMKLSFSCMHIFALR